MAATAEILAEIAAEAGKVVLRHYQAGPLAGKNLAREKSDRSPVTDADEEADGRRDELHVGDAAARRHPDIAAAERADGVL